MYCPAAWENGGVPVIVPVNVSNDSPAGRPGETSHVISPTSISVEKSDSERTASYKYRSSRMPSNASIVPLVANKPTSANSDEADEVKS